MASPRKSLSELARASTKQTTEAPEPTTKPAATANIADAIASRIRTQKTDRPQKPKKLNVELDPDFYDAVAIKAKQDGLTLSDLTRHLFRLYLEA